jgi:hypothetical protein
MRGVFIKEALQCRHQIVSGELGRGRDAQFTAQFAAQGGDTLLPPLGSMQH